MSDHDGTKLDLSQLSVRSNSSYEKAKRYSDQIDLDQSSPKANKNANFYESNESSISGVSSESCVSIEEDWSYYIKRDGSLTFIESYLASTLKEKHIAKDNQDSENKTIFPSQRKNIKHHAKLLNLLRRRPSIRVKSRSATFEVQDKTLPLPVTGIDPTSPKVTFRDIPSGEARKVILNVTNYETNLGRRSSLCESVLGIIPGFFSESPDPRVMVAGFAPGSQTLKDGIVKIGDWLKEINSLEVTWENLDLLLMEIKFPDTVSLTVLKCASETLQEDLFNDKKLIQTELVKLISGNESAITGWNLKCESSKLPPHTILYLSLSGVTENSKDKEDIRYQFPHSPNKLVQVRGMFITMSHSLQEIASCPVLSCSITLEGEHYHVAFTREENDILLIALPHEYICRSGIITLMEQISKHLIYEFGSVANAMMDQENHYSLDHLFFLLLDDIFHYKERTHIENGAFSSPSFALHDYVSFKNNLVNALPLWLSLKDTYSKLQIETCLNELESADFGENESDCEDCQLLYNILGCCIFYKDCLVASHLDKDDLECIWLFLQRRRLLELLKKEAVSQIILWKRVFPNLEMDEDSVPPPEETRHYLLIVAMNHLLLVTLVESGNVTELLDKEEGPDPFLVDQIETTLYHLHSLHVHSACEESYSWTNFEMTPLDNKLTIGSAKSKRRNTDTLEERRPPSILKAPPLLHMHDDLPCDCAPSPPPGSLPEDDDPDSTLDSEFTIYKGQEFHIRDIHSPDNSSAFGSREKSSTGNSSVRLTTGESDVLLHLVQVEGGRGVVVTTASEDDSMHAQLLQNFYTSCAHVKHVLSIGNRNKTVCSNYSGTSVMNNIKEYGTLFEASGAPSTTKKKSASVSYWIVGRIYGPPYEREIYVALEDSIPQNIQEIAFKLSLHIS